MAVEFYSSLFKAEHEIEEGFIKICFPAMEEGQRTKTKKISNGDGFMEST